MMELLLFYLAGYGCLDSISVNGASCGEHYTINDRYADCKANLGGYESLQSCMAGWQTFTSFPAESTDYYCVKRGFIIPELVSGGKT